MEFLSAQWVVNRHEEILKRLGGESGILAESSLVNAIERHRHGPFHGAGDVVERAAYLFRGLVQDHPFVDGNKRTAIDATWEFLRLNRIYIRATTDEVVEFALAGAMGDPVHASERWLRARAQTSRDGTGKEGA